MTLRRASDAARPAECFTLTFGVLPITGFRIGAGAAVVAGAEAAAVSTFCAAGCCLPAVTVRIRSALCTAALPAVDIALRRASDAERALEPGAVDAAARTGADCVRAGADCVFAGADRARSVAPAEDAVPNAALPPVLMAWRLAITSSRVLCVVAVCPIVNPVESTFHPVIHACVNRRG